MDEEAFTNFGNSTIRVTNFSDKINEREFRDLFSPYGKINVVFLDKKDKRGLAFVKFENRKDAEDAASLILSMECSLVYLYRTKRKKNFLLFLCKLDYQLFFGNCILVLLLYL